MIRNWLVGWLHRSKPNTQSHNTQGIRTCLDRHIDNQIPDLDLVVVVVVVHTEIIIQKEK